MNSFGVRSAIVMRWRGAFVAGVEYDRIVVFERLRRADDAIVGQKDGIVMTGMRENDQLRGLFQALLILLYIFMLLA